MTPEQVRRWARLLRPTCVISRAASVRTAPANTCTATAAGLSPTCPEERRTMALAAGTAVRTLQEFVKDHVWD